MSHADNSSEDRQHALITKMEGAILAHVGLGRSNKEIARELGVTPETVKTHLKRIFIKLSAGTRAEAVARATDLGLVDFTDGEDESIDAFRFNPPRS